MVIPDLNELIGKRIQWRTMRDRRCGLVIKVSRIPDCVECRVDGHPYPHAIVNVIDILYVYDR